MGWGGFCTETGTEVMSGEGQASKSRGRSSTGARRDGGCQRQGRLRNPAVWHGGGEARALDSD